MSDPDQSINIEGSTFGDNATIGSGNVNIGPGSVAHTGKGKQRIEGRNKTVLGDESHTTLHLTANEVQQLNDLTETVKALMRRVPLSNAEEAHVLASVQTLEAQAERPETPIPGTRKAIAVVADLVRRFPEQAAASTVGSVAAAVLLEQVAQLLG